MHFCFFVISQIWHKVKRPTTILYYWLYIQINWLLEQENLMPEDPVYTLRNNGNFSIYVLPVNMYVVSLISFKK